MSTHFTEERNWDGTQNDIAAPLFQKFLRLSKRGRLCTKRPRARISLKRKRVLGVQTAAAKGSRWVSKQGDGVKRLISNGGKVKELTAEFAFSTHTANTSLLYDKLYNIVGIYALPTIFRYLSKFVGRY